MPILNEIPEPYTNQTLFNRAWYWLNRPEFAYCVQKRDSGKSTCLYRSEDLTNACLFGACIPDKYYSSNMESGQADIFKYRFKDTTENLFDNIDFDLAIEIQKCHDECYTNDPVNSRWFQRQKQLSIDGMRKVAKKYNLTIPGEENENNIS